MIHVELKKSIGARLVIMVALAAALLLPSSMISGIINERENRRNEAIAEVVSKWGMKQTICGPILTVPYSVVTRDSTGKPISITKNNIQILPESLNISGVIDPEIRYRGIYEVVLYGSKMKICGSFARPDVQSMNIDESVVDWNNAYLTVGISDMRGIKETIKIECDGNAYLAAPGTQTQEVESGVSITIPIDSSKKKLDFKTELSLMGSEELNFIPVGKETEVALSSKWRNPSFTGYFLPVSRAIDQNGFNARWRVFNLNRNFPQTWVYGKYNLSESAFGVGLLLPVDGYQTTTRTNKYAVLFIVLTFLAFFLTEIIGKRPIHPMQYLLIGAAQVLFYILLLSLTEHVAFAWAYLISSMSLVTLVTLYSISVLKNKKSTSVISVLLTLLYCYLYIVLQMQDYALLLGSVGLFAIVGGLMYITRNIDWFALFSCQKSGDKEAE